MIGAVVMALPTLSYMFVFPQEPIRTDSRYQATK